MPYKRLDVQLNEDQEVQGHMAREGQRVRVRLTSGQEVAGHVVGMEGGEAEGPAGRTRLRLELEDDTEGQAIRWKLDQQGEDVTIRFEDGGEEVKGHGFRIK